MAKLTIEKAEKLVVVSSSLLFTQINCFAILLPVIARNAAANIRVKEARCSEVTLGESAFGMDAVDVAGFLEFDSIVLRDDLLDSSEAIQQVVSEKWTFKKESMGKSRSRCSEEASDVGIRVEGEVIYLDVEEEDDQDVDVEGDETASVNRPPGNIQSRGVSSVDNNIKLTRVPGVKQCEEPKSVSSHERSEGVSECDDSFLRAISASSTCSLCLRHFSSEADRTNHVCVVTSAVQRSLQNYSYRGEGIAGVSSSGSFDTWQIPKLMKEKHAETSKCKTLSDESDRVLHPKDCAFATVTGGSKVDSAREDSRSTHIPTLSEAGTSVPSKTAVDAPLYFWKYAMGVCGICGKVFNNNSNLKRHAHKHGSGIRFTCDICGQFFLDRCSLWRHKELHTFPKTHSKMYECSVCGKCVNSSFSLRKHRAQHIQPYVCEVCGESFHRASGLQIHKYLHVR